ncbi:hypothetical protein [Moorena producens]|uniref:hypothetical protein n=1 Tax=Moorena producens TaxID=1155739 RepID=UPI001314CE75|nr:hypothetical protein [Moorena producens]
MSRWCVTGRTIPTLALRNNKRKSALNAPYALPHLPISPTPYSLLPTPYFGTDQERT